MQSGSVFRNTLFLSVASGLLLWFSWPVAGFAGLIFVAFVPLLLAEDRLSQQAGRRRALRAFGHFFLGLIIWNLGTTYWIYNSTGVGAVMALGLNALFMSMVWLLFHLTKRKLGAAAGYISLIVYWISWELMHLNWDISWPWLTLGNCFANTISWVQWYEYTGVFGGTLWIWVANLVVFYIIK